MITLFINIPFSPTIHSGLFSVPAEALRESLRHKQPKAKGKRRKREI